MKPPDTSSKGSLEEVAHGYATPASTGKLTGSGTRMFILINCKSAGKFGAANAKFEEKPLACPS